MNVANQLSICNGIGVLPAAVSHQIYSAAALIKTASKAGEVTDQFINNMLAGNGAWQKEFWGFTSYVPTGSGRRAGIDLYSKSSGVAIEVELSNQTALSHDVMKLSAAHAIGVAQVGVVICLDGQHSLGYTAPSSACLFFPYVQRWSAMFGHLVSVPIAVYALG